MYISTEERVRVCVCVRTHITKYTRTCIQTDRQTDRDFLVPSSYFLVLTSYFLVPISYLLVPTSYFLVPTSYFLVPTSYFQVV